MPILHRTLQDNGVAVEYLKDALEDNDHAVFYSALKDVVDARMGMSRLAREKLPAHNPNGSNP